MFSFLKKTGKNKYLESILESLRMNLSNNYKDAAQQDLKEFETALKELTEAGELGKGQISYYGVKLSEFQQNLKNFTHKDQKVGW